MIQKINHHQTNMCKFYSKNHNCVPFFLLVRKYAFIKTNERINKDIQETKFNKKEKTLRRATKANSNPKEQDNSMLIVTKRFNN